MEQIDWKVEPRAPVPERLVAGVTYKVTYVLSSLQNPLENQVALVGSFSI